RDLLPRDSFLTTSSMIATRGCHNRCGFCYLSTRGLHMPYRMRDVEQIVEEIRADGQPYVVFIDNNLGSRPDYLRRLCRAIEPLGIIWSAAVTIDVTDDPSLIREMALSGCTGVFIGFESLELGNLTDARKRTPIPEDYARRVAILHDHGIQVNGSFVRGFDHDGPDVFEKTVEWIEANRLECATFHILTPYPGTPLFADLERQNRIVHRDWRLYDTAHVVFEPKRMSAEELFAGYEWCYRRLFSHRSIWRRRPKDWRAVPAYLAMSYLYKRSNLIWHWLIRLRLTALVWRPLIELSRRRHLRFRARLAAGTSNGKTGRHVISAGVGSGSGARRGAPAPPRGFGASGTRFGPAFSSGLDGAHRPADGLADPVARRLRIAANPLEIDADERAAALAYAPRDEHRIDVTRVHRE